MIHLKNKSTITELLLITPWLLLSLSYLMGHTISENTEFFIFSASMVLTGIPHGALDHLVEKQNKELKGKTFSLILFLLEYIARMTFFAFVWYVSPILALIIFLAISALHFGETDLYESSFSSFMYGLGLLLFLLMAHIETVIPIIKSIPTFQSMNVFFLLENKPILIGLGGLIPIIIILLSANSKHVIIRLLLRTTIILLIVYILPLLLAFTFYFGCWHSLRSLNFIRKHLSTPEKKMGWIDLVIKALPFSLVAVFFISLFIYFLYTFFGMSITLMSLFIGVAILTAPHLTVMSEMFAHIKKLKA